MRRIITDHESVHRPPSDTDSGNLHSSWNQLMRVRSGDQGITADKIHLMFPKISSSLDRMDNTHRPDPISPEEASLFMQVHKALQGATPYSDMQKIEDSLR